MKLEDFKKMTLEARLDYLFNKSQTPKPRNLVYKDEALWIDEDGTFTKEAFDSLPTHQPTIEE